ncbi:MAG: TonB-dependent receptor [Sphingopyxis sp.]|uniref:TonB-dependent receptor plug domain-containing protein n=1 Tax=Sphingopyxis sp. TaxID=1908224 RepID=UPI002AB95083|nr:TonB-dependent receptor [Sphingopyxis sp.]MDZ3833625.1 TonB-dependent receptor [Sphingopyxis sp.]
MGFRGILRARSGLLALIAALASAPAAAHQGTEGSAADGEPGGDTSQEPIIVTGSYLNPHAVDRSSPIHVLDSGELKSSGVSTVADIARNMTVNTGSQFNTDERTQGGTTGTSNFNLRGLGVGSTLVLVDGRRRPNSLPNTNDGVTFVDTNLLLPMNMVERVEVLKDGAASLYGSDAVAGVVNFISKRKFKGLEVEANYRAAGNSSATRDVEFGGVYGYQGGRFGIVIGANYLDRSLMTADEVDFGMGSSFTSLGGPGAFQPAFKPFTGPGVPLPDRPTVVVGPPTADPGCVANGGVVTRGTGTATFCGFSLDPYLTLVADEQRFQAATNMHYELSDNARMTLDISYARNKSYRAAAPSYPLVSLPFVPASNPGFQPGSVPGSVAGAVNALNLPPSFTRGAIFYGRAFPTAGEAKKDRFEHTSLSVVAGLAGTIGGGWDYDLGLGYTRLETRTVLEDLLEDRFLAALEGKGGPNNNQYFNPFASGIGASPGSPFYNDPAVIADFSSSLRTNSSANFLVLDAVVTGKPFALGGRDVGLAVGLQWRDDSRRMNFNQEALDKRLMFLYGRQNGRFHRDVVAAFGELSWPLTERLEVQTAIRLEDHGGGVGRSVDPKVAALWRASDAITFRGSYSTAFRAPQYAQNGASSLLVTQERVTDAANPTGQASFVPVVRRGNPGLRPETSDSINVGATFRPIPGLFLTVDHWRFDIKNLIAGQTAQDLADSGNPDNVLRSPIGSIERLEGTFFNVSSLKTNGIDVELSYRADIGDAGKIRFNLAATKILDYKFREAAGQPLIDRVGRRNFGTIASPTPDLRANLTVQWTLEGHSLTTNFRYVDSYINDELLVRIPPRPVETIRSWTTMDVQYAVDLDEAFGSTFGTGTQFSIGALNIFDRDPPRASTENGLPYDSRVHDPRGRVLYARIVQSF